MKMKDVKSNTWIKLAEIKTKAKTTHGIYHAVCRELGEKFFSDNELYESGTVDKLIKSYVDFGFIQLCDDGIIVWMDAK